MYTSWVVCFPDEVVHLHILRIHFIFCILGILLFPPKLAKLIPIISPAVYMQKLFQYLTIIVHISPYCVCVIDTIDAKKKVIIQNWKRMISIDTCLEKKVAWSSFAKNIWQVP